jgi:tetratricopeptide (TPR) repeat protein
VRRILILAVVAVAVAVAVAACGSKPAPPGRLQPLPRDAYAHYLRAKVAIYESDYELAVHELRAAAAAAPGEAMIAVALSGALSRAGEGAAAAAVILAAQQRWPDEPEVWLGAGSLFQDQGKHDLARDAYERAVELDRRSERGYLGLASTWIALRQPARAAKAWQELLEAVPDSVEGHYRLAVHVQGRGVDRGAEPHLRRVLERDPDHLDARLALARVLRALGRLDEAIGQTRQAFDRSGQDAEIAEELFWLLCERDDRRGALDLLGLLDDDGATLEIRLALVRLYLAIDDVGAARRVADQASASAPDRGDTAVALARVLRADGDLVAAAAAVEAVPATSPAYVTARTMLAEIAIARGRPDDAIAAIAGARADHPRNPGLAAAEAAALSARGSDRDGAAILEALWKTRRRDPAVVIAFASYEERAGRSEHALALLDELLRVRPNHAGALNLAGYLRAELDLDLPRAERDLARARKLAPGDPAILDSWGWLAFRKGELATAAKVLNHAVRLSPRQPELLFHLGEVLAASGDRVGARKVLELARGLSPTPVVKQRIDARLAALGR